jgi:hypothetical protein
MAVNLYPFYYVQGIGHINAFPLKDCLNPPQGSGVMVILRLTAQDPTFKIVRVEQTNDAQQSFEKLGRQPGIFTNEYTHVAFQPCNPSEVEEIMFKITDSKS